MSKPIKKYNLNELSDKDALFEVHKYIRIRERNGYDDGYVDSGEQIYRAARFYVTKERAEYLYNLWEVSYVINYVFKFWLSIWKPIGTIDDFWKGYSYDKNKAKLKLRNGSYKTIAEREGCELSAKKIVISSLSQVVSLSSLSES